ncbi:MAG TPA: hypothetical protein VMD75_08825, partial [Candidatus Binataceae bacterium]|nr:hypothetical protein [Candidatus Binataceae bacterium]
SKPDVLVSAIGMPLEEGYSLIRKIRILGSEHGGDIPACALTGWMEFSLGARACDLCRLPTSSNQASPTSNG